MTALQLLIFLEIGIDHMGTQLNLIFRMVMENINLNFTDGKIIIGHFQTMFILILEILVRQMV